MNTHKFFKTAMLLLGTGAMVSLAACSGAKDSPQTNETVAQTLHIVTEVEKMAMAAGTTRGEFRTGIIEKITDASKEDLQVWRSTGYNKWKAENFKPKFDAQFIEFYQYGLANLDKKEGFEALIMALHIAEFQDAKILSDIHQKLYENYSDEPEYAYVMGRIAYDSNTGFSYRDFKENNPDSKNVFQDSRPAREAYVMSLLSRVAEKTNSKVIKNHALVSMGDYLGRSLDYMDIKDLDAVAKRRDRAAGYLETAIDNTKKTPLAVMAAKDVNILAVYDKSRIAASPPPAPVPEGRVISTEPRPIYTLKEIAEKHLYVVRGISVGAYLPSTIGEDLEGNPQDIAQYKGRVLLIDFWATWCGPCIAKFPHFRELKETYAGRPFEILGVSADDTVEIVHEFLLDNEAPWDMWYSGPRGGVREKWQAYGLPQMFVVDHTGMIRTVYMSGAAEGMDEIVASLVTDAEKAIKISNTKPVP